MFKRQTRHVAMFLCLCSALAVSTTNQAADSKANDNLDHVLSELSRQHNNASDLVKSAREPASINTSLALNSQILANEKKSQSMIKTY